EVLDDLPGIALALFGGVREDRQPAASGGHPRGLLRGQEAAPEIEGRSVLDPAQGARGLQDRRAGAGGEVTGGVGGEIAGAVVVDEGPVVRESGDRGLGGQLEVQAVGVRTPEGPYRALEVPVVTADVGAHGDRVAVVHVACDL